MTPLETCPAKCIALNEFPSVRKRYLEKLHTRVKFMIVLTECADGSFSTAVTWVAFLNSTWVPFGGRGRKGSQVGA